MYGRTFLRDYAATPTGRLRLVVGYVGLAVALRAPFVLEAGGTAAALSLARDAVALAVKTLLAVVLPIVFLRHVSPETPLKRALRLSPAGTASGVARATIVALLFFALIYALSSLQDGHLRRIALGSWPFAALGVLHVIVEEIGARGFVLTFLAEGRTFARANVILSGLFVSLHWPVWYVAGMRWEILPVTVVLFVVSLVLGWVTKLSGSIWIAVALHAANNALAGH